MMPAQLEQHSSIHIEHHAQALPEQCPTNATNVLTKIFGLLENPSHLSNVRRGAAKFASIRSEIRAVAALQAVSHA